MNKTQTKPRNDYRIRGKRVWALAQARYLEGQSALVVAEALGLTEYAIRKRISREGWSKRLLAEAEETGVPDPPPDTGWRATTAFSKVGSDAFAATPESEAMEPRAAARAALEAAARLIREGRMMAAAEAARTADVMARAAARLDGDAALDPGEPDEAAFEAVRRKVLGWGDEAEADGATPPPPCGRSPSPQGGEETG